jgi:hypothetical protein
MYSTYYFKPSDIIVNSTDSINPDDIESLIICTKVVFSGTSIGVEAADFFSFGNGRLDSITSVLLGLGKEDILGDMSENDSKYFSGESDDEFEITTYSLNF